ncbi:MAG: GyrI-like domain-containing protein, partial [Elusimicrobiota bacterium]
MTLNFKKISLVQREYQKRLNQVLEHIDINLGHKIDLLKLAAIANFSPYHFHRIFTAMVGESPADYVRRMRLERAANQLIFNPLKSITEIAFECGFSSSAIFSRLFRKRFGRMPKEWRNKTFKVAALKISKKSKVNSKKEKAISLLSGYNKVSKKSERRKKRAMNQELKNVKVEVRQTPSIRVAYVKHMKGYEDSAGIGAAFEKLFMWAGPRGFMTPDVKVMGISMDNPDITPTDKCRYYACLAVSGEAKPEGEVGIIETHAGMYAVAHFRGKQDVFKKAYSFIYGEWLPKSGYQPDDFPTY